MVVVAYPEPYPDPKPFFSGLFGLFETLTLKYPICGILGLPLVELGTLPCRLLSLGVDSLGKGGLLRPCCLFFVSRDLFCSASWNSVFLPNSSSRTSSSCSRSISLSLFLGDLCKFPYFFRRLRRGSQAAWEFWTKMRECWNERQSNLFYHSLSGRFSLRLTLWYQLPMSSSAGLLIELIEQSATNPIRYSIGLSGSVQASKKNLMSEMIT